MPTIETYVWVTGSGYYLVRATSEDEAYRKVIARRMSTGQSLEDAVGWFQHDDQLIGPLDSEVTDPPFEGDLPNVDVG